MLLWRPSLFWACFTACWAITEQITNYKLPFEVEIFVSEVPVSHSVAPKRKQNASKGLHSSVFHFCCGLNTNIYTMATANWINIDVYWLEKKTEIKRNISWDCKLCMFRCQTFWFRSFRKITAKLRQWKKVSVWELFGVKLVCKAAGENLLRVDKSFA